MPLAHIVLCTHNSITCKFLEIFMWQVDKWYWQILCRRKHKFTIAMVTSVTMLSSKKKITKFETWISARKSLLWHQELLPQAHKMIPLVLLTAKRTNQVCFAHVSFNVIVLNDGVVTPRVADTRKAKV